jgi:hypothetical protein
VIKSRRIGWAGYVGTLRKEKVLMAFWWKSLRERDHLKGPDIDGRII